MKTLWRYKGREVKRVYVLAKVDILQVMLAVHTGDGEENILVLVFSYDVYSGADGSAYRGDSVEYGGGYKVFYGGYSEVHMNIHNCENTLFLLALI